MGLVVAWKRGYPIGQLLLSGMPLSAYVVKVAVEKGSLLWWLLLHIKVHLHAQLPVLDGVFGTPLDPGLHNVFKGIFLIGLFVGCLWVTYHQVRTRSWLMLAIAGGTLFAFLILNRAAIWAAVRHARLVAVPAALAIYASPRRAAFFNRTRVFVLLATGLIASQVLFGWYIKQFFVSALATLLD